MSSGFPSCRLIVVSRSPKVYCGASESDRLVDRTASYSCFFHKHLRMHTRYIKLQLTSTMISKQLSRHQYRVWDMREKAGVSNFSRWVCLRNNMCLAVVSNSLEAVSCCIPRQFRCVLLPWLLNFEFVFFQGTEKGQKSIYNSLHLRPIYSSRPLLREINTGYLCDIQSWF